LKSEKFRTMKIGRSSNPALTKNSFVQAMYRTADERAMTIQGTVNKSLILLILVLLGAIYTWNLFFNAIDSQAGISKIIPWMIGGGVGGFVVALITIFKKTWAQYTAPLYGVLEGLFLGGLSALVEVQFEGKALVMQAVALTFGTLFALLFAYKSGWIKVTRNFRLGVVAATGGIALVYLISFVVSLFGVRLSFIYGNSLLSIGISLFVVVIAALNLVLDFDFIEEGAKAGAPKYMEWYAAFGLMITLIWLYIEILRLLTKLASRK